MRLNKFLKMISSFILIFNVISLYVHAEEISLRLFKMEATSVVRVKTEDTISTLREIAGFSPKEKLKFIFNGQTIAEESSFERYNIKCGDIIFIFECKTSYGKDIQEKWLSATRNAEYFHNAIRSIFDPTYKKESIRLKDLQLLRDESKLKKLRVAPTCSVLHYSPDRVKRSENIAPTNLKYEPKLSEEPLPTFW